MFTEEEAQVEERADEEEKAEEGEVMGRLSIGNPFSFVIRSYRSKTSHYTTIGC